MADTNYNSIYTGPEIDAAIGRSITGGEIDSKINMVALQHNLSLYVSPSGSDETGDGTAGNPYATPQKALDSLPKNLNGYTAYVHLASGTYSGVTTVRGFHGGELWMGDINNSAEITLGKLMVHESDYVYLLLDTISGSGDANTGTLFVSASCVTLGQETTIDGLGTAYGVWVQNGGVLETGYNVGLTINNCPLAAWVLAGGKLGVFGALAGTGNTTGLQSTGSLITFGSCSMTASTLYSKQSGGQILTGAGVIPT